MQPAVLLLSLGCEKNRVDSERLASLLFRLGYQVHWCEDEHSLDETVSRLQNASHTYVLIQTCGFILPAQEESIHTILHALHLKKKGKVREVWVTGCLVARFASELQKELPEVDFWAGPEAYHTLFHYARRNCHHDPSRFSSTWIPDLPERTFRSTPSHYAYIKIAEGCNRKCSFCAIPSIRGKMRSRSVEEIVAEARTLLHQGVRELLLVSQDTSLYGKDLYGEIRLIHLVDALADLQKEVPQPFWIRLHYLHPRPLNRDLLARMEDPAHPLIPYLDMPVQHASEQVLRAMRRGTPRSYLDELIAFIREEAPHVAFRTTLITGFPTETPEDLELLLDALRLWKPERISVFPYWHEAGTYAFRKWKDIWTSTQKQERIRKIFALYEQVLLPEAHHRLQQISRTSPEGIPVFIDEKTPDALLGRTWWDAPEIDATVYLPPSVSADPGVFLNVEITDFDGLDLWGTPCPSSKRFPLQKANRPKNTSTCKMELPPRKPISPKTISC